MSLAPMKRVSILAPKDLRLELLDLLQRLEAIEITELAEADLSPLDPETSSTISSEITRMEEELKKVQGSIRFLRTEFREKRSIIDQFASTRIPVGSDIYSQIRQEPGSVLEICEQVQELERRLADLAKTESECRANLAALDPWLTLDAPLVEFSGTASCEIKLGTVETSRYEALAEDLEANPRPVHLEVINRSSTLSYLFILYAKEDSGEITALLTKHSFVEARLPQDEEEAKAVHARIAVELESIRAQASKLRERLTKLNDANTQILSLSDILQAELQKRVVAKELGDTGHVLVLSGWARESDLPGISMALEELHPAIVIDSRDPIEGEKVPVDFENPAWVKPFEVVTTTAGVPKRGTPDPTPALVPFFFLFFGMALGDAGYGIILSVMALWLMKRTRAVGDGKNFLKILAVCGISTFAFGALTGSWFGDLIKIPPIWFNPVENPMQMLIVSLCLGLIHLFVGLGVTFIHNIKQGRIWDALFDQGLWWVFISGLASMLALPTWAGSKYLAIAGAAGLILTQGRKEKSIIKKIFKGLSSLMGVSGYLSDVLSYSRLLALGLASAVIGIVINDVSEMVGGAPIIGPIIVALILAGGHLFNLLINVVSAYVHTSRLQYVEFFGKCFDGGGRLFAPFALRTKMVQVISEGTENMSLDVKGGASEWKSHGGQY